MGHVHLIVEDPDAQKKLWVGMLGAEVTKIGSLELLKLPGVFILVAKARTLPTQGSAESTVNHFGFVVKSYPEIKAKLAGANLTLASDDADAKEVIAVFPDGVRVEFTEDSTASVPIAFRHIHIAATNPEKLRAWYVKTFGATEGASGKSLAAVVPGGEVDFLKVSAARAPTKGRALDHIGFEVVGLEAFCKKLQADGATFDGPYRESTTTPGLRTAYIIDPEGTRIELTEGFAAH